LLVVAIEDSAIFAKYHATFQHYGCGMSLASRGASQIRVALLMGSHPQCGRRLPRPVNDSAIDSWPSRTHEIAGLDNRREPSRSRIGEADNFSVFHDLLGVRWK